MVENVIGRRSIGLEFAAQTKNNLYLVHLNVKIEIVWICVDESLELYEYALLIWIQKNEQIHDLTVIASLFPNKDLHPIDIHKQNMRIQTNSYSRAVQGKQSPVSVQLKPVVMPQEDALGLGNTSIANAKPSTLPVAVCDRNVHSKWVHQNLVVTVADDQSICKDQLPHHHALFQRGHTPLLQPVAVDHHHVVVIDYHHWIRLATAHKEETYQCSINGWRCILIIT